MLRLDVHPAFCTQAQHHSSSRPGAGGRPTLIESGGTWYNSDWPVPRTRRNIHPLLGTTAIVMPSLLKTSTARAAGASFLLLLVSAAALLGFGGLAAAPHGTGAARPAAQAATATAAPASPITATATVTATGTATATVDPLQLFHPFDFVPEGGVLIKESVTELGGGTPPEGLLTMSITAPQTNTNGIVETTTVSSLRVLRYDKGDWTVLWQPQPDVPGQAIALPETRGTSPDRYQAGDLLRTGQPILLLRTQQAGPTPTDPPTVTLHLWAWTGDTAIPLQMATADGKVRDAVFTGTSDVQTADLDDDGVIEVIVDSGPTTTIYRWDAAQTHFVVRK